MTRHASKPATLKQAVKTGIFAYLGLRIWSTAVLLLLTVYPPTVQPSSEPARGMLTVLENSSAISRLFLAPWYRWDTVHYLDIAQSGYSRAFLSVWPPLYSGLIQLVSFTGISLIAAAVLVSNLCAVGAFILLYRMAEDLTEGAGNRALFLLAVFPTSFFLVAGYSEPLFILLAAGSLYACRQRSLWLAGLLASLAVLTRLQGVILALPLVYEGFVLYRHARWGKTLRVRLFEFLKIAIPAALPVLTAAGFAAYVRFVLKYPWPWETLAAEWGQHTGWPWEGIAGNFTSLAGLRLLTTPINPLAQITDLTAVLFLIILTGLMVTRWRDFPIGYTLYTVAGLLLVLTKLDDQGLLVSVSRYALSLIPVFLFAAAKQRRPLPPWANLLLLATGLTAHAVLLVCFARWIWIA